MALRRALALLATLTASSLLLAASASANVADVPLMWRASLASPRGELECEYGDPDCNRCVINVRAAFDEFSGSGGNNRVFDFHGGTYAPQGHSLEDDVLQWNAGKGHFQGFVRLPIDAGRPDVQWFAASHSGKDDPDEEGFFVLYSRTPVGSWRDGYYQQYGFEDEKVRYVYKTSRPSAHPGGMAAIGGYLLIGHDLDDGQKPAYFESYDVTSPDRVHRTGEVSLGGKGPDGKDLNYRAANVAAAKLADGGFLLISNYSSMRSKYDFWHANDIETFSGFVHLGQTSAHVGNENISLITECNTGDLYMVGAQGPGTEVAGDNRWSLYQVVRHSETPTIQPIVSTHKDKDEECNARAGGTMTAGRYGKLVTYCHEKLAGGAESEIDYREYENGFESGFDGPVGMICRAHEHCCGVIMDNGRCTECRQEGAACEGEDLPPGVDPH